MESEVKNLIRLAEIGKKQKTKKKNQKCQSGDFGPDIPSLITPYK